jgi:hypothetical protein
VVAEADVAVVALADAAVEVATVDEAHLITTTIRRLQHLFACRETTSRSIFNGNHLWCKSIHHLRIDIQGRSPEGYRVLLIFKALCFSIGYNIITRIMKQLIKPIVKPAISSVVRRYDEIRNAKDFTVPMANLYMVIFSSRLPIYMRLAFIPGIIIAIIKSTVHSIANILRNFGDRCERNKTLWPIAGVIKWALGPRECRQARRLRLRKPTSYLCCRRRSILLNKVLFICFVMFPVMDKTFVKAPQLHTTVQWIPWTPMPPRCHRFHPDSRELLCLDREMDWDRMCKDPSIWLTDEERNPAKRHITGTTRN